MNLYIETKNGAIKNHPAFEDNILQAFGFIPDHWEPFVRVERPNLGVYEALERPEPTYEKVDGVWTDVWHKRDMTAEEKTSIQQEIITAFNNREYATNWSAWILDTTRNTMVPPILRPKLDQTKLDAGISTFWCGADNNWKDTPVCPKGEFKFDFFIWDWVAL